MKIGSRLLKSVAIFLFVAILMLVFSSLIFVGHDCHHSDSCAICSYYKELNKSQIIPLILVAFAYLLACTCKLISRLFGEQISRGTPIKLRVKLSR